MIDKEDIERLDERYVMQKDCTARQEEQDEKINELRLRLVKVDTKLGVLIGILSAIGVPVIAIAVKLLFGVT